MQIYVYFWKVSEFLNYIDGLLMQDVIDGYLQSYFVGVGFCVGGSIKIKYLVIQFYYKGVFEGKYFRYISICIIINCVFCSINL